MRLKTLKNIIKVHEVSRRYIILFMHNNRYLPSTGLLTKRYLHYLLKNVVKFYQYFIKYFHEIFQAKKLNEISPHQL